MSKKNSQPKAKSWQVMGPICDILAATANDFGAQSYSFGIQAAGLLLEKEPCSCQNFLHQSLPQVCTY